MAKSQGLTLLSKGIHFSEMIPFAVLIPTDTREGGPDAHFRGTFAPIHSLIAFSTPATSTYSIPSGFVLC